MSTLALDDSRWLSVADEKARLTRRIAEADPWSPRIIDGRWGIIAHYGGDEEFHFRPVTDDDILAHERYAPRREEISRMSPREQVRAYLQTTGERGDRDVEELLDWIGSRDLDI